MNMFQFAVASIVDANTGNGLVHNTGTRDYVTAERYGRKIRSRSVADLFTAITDSIGSAIDSYMVRAKQRRAVQNLMNLSDHVLSDIGVTRNDLYAVQLGAMSLDELEHSRRPIQELDGVDNSSAIDAAVNVLDATNDQTFELKKCA